MSSIRDVVMIGPDHRAVGGMASVTNNLSGELEASSRYRCRIVDSGGGTGPRGWWGYPKAVLRASTAPADIVHLHVASAGSTWRKMTFAVIASVRRKPYVIHLHGSTYGDFLDHLNPPLRAVVRRFFSSAARVIVLGESWRELLQTRLRLREGHVVVIANGVREVEARVRPGPASVDSPYRVVFVGEVSQRKGADTLAGVADRLLSELPELIFDILGPFPDQRIADKVHALAEAHDRFRVHGPLTGERKEALIAGADVFVLPSVAEGLPMAMLEAMSAGVVPVVTPVGAIAEVITDGRNGRLVPPRDDDALAKVLIELADPQVRTPLAEAARIDWRTKFSATTMTAAVCEVWDEVLRRARP